jgi:formylglycine-generating enzyme required for sulfatase activity
MSEPPKYDTEYRDLPPQSRLQNRYTLLKKLDTGGRSEIWLAEDSLRPPVQGQVVQVVLKLLPVALRSDPAANAAFKQEYSIFWRLTHPSICQHFDLGEDSCYGAFQVMEYLPGHALRKELEAAAGPLPGPLVSKVLSACAEALDYAHTCRDPVIHRDVKPENVMYDQASGSVHLIDFGHAAAIRGDRAGYRQAAIAGPTTKYYSAPEQWRNDPQGPPCDQWSLGVMAWELLTGQLPFMGNTDQLQAAICAAVLPPLPYSLQPLRPVFQRVLQPDPAARFDKCLSFVKALQQALPHYLAPHATTAPGFDSPQNSPPVTAAVDPLLAALQASNREGCCWKCSFINPLDRAYCRDCGGNLAEPCLGCSQLIGVWERFCPRCGANQVDLRQALKRDADQAVLEIQGYLQDRRYDLAQSLLQAQRQRLVTERLQRLRPELTQLQMDCQQVREAVEQVLDQALEAGAASDYDDALQLLTEIPAALWPEESQDWQRNLAELTDLQQQLAGLVAAGELTQLQQMLSRMEQLQPGRWVGRRHEQSCVLKLLQHVEQLLEARDAVAAWDVFDRHPGVSDSPHGQQWIRRRVEHAGSAAAKGNYKAAIDLLAVLPHRVWPAMAADWQTHVMSFPCSATEANNAQTAVAAILQIPIELTNGFGMRLRLIPPGTFAMGSAARQGSVDERPQHKVTISRGFYLGVHSVTQGQWQQLMSTTPWQGQKYVKIGGTIAATYVSWEDSVEFCQRLSARDGRRYRLPTEAEWEWSCRAGTTTQYSFGDEEKQLGQYAWYGGNAWNKKEKYAHAVGQKLANPFGLYDMHGNVWEWCSDWYDEKYYGKSPEQDPTGPASGSSRVLRGGGWRDWPIGLRSCYRDCYAFGNRDGSIGLRVLCELE